MATATANSILVRKFAHAAVPTQPGTTKAGVTWKYIYYFVSIPCIGLSVVSNYLYGKHPDPPEFVPYEHLRIRNRRYPWGDGVRSFFHNPHTNPLPTGYEDH